MEYAGCLGAEVGGKGNKVGGVRADDVVGKAYGDSYEVGVDDIRGVGSAEQPPDDVSIGESEIVHLYGAEELGQPGLLASVSPYLSDNRSGGVQHRSRFERRG